VLAITAVRDVVKKEPGRYDMRKTPLESPLMQTLKNQSLILL